MRLAPHAWPTARGALELQSIEALDGGKPPRDRGGLGLGAELVGEPAFDVAAVGGEKPPRAEPARPRREVAPIARKRRRREPVREPQLIAERVDQFGVAHQAPNR